MTKKLLLPLLLLATSSLSAQNAQQIANSLVIPEITADTRQLPMPEISGAKIEFLGADYEELIDSKGKISPVIADTPVNISFTVTKNGKKAVSRDYEVILKAPASKPGNAKPDVIPEILQWSGGQGEYRLGDTVNIYCPDAALARIFASELREQSGKKVAIVDSAAVAHIAFDKYRDAPLGKEGYSLRINNKGVRITANTYTGQYWGTRTLLQMLRQKPDSLPCGTAIDFPRYPVRGCVLDIARTPYPLTYLKDLIRAMSWYKMNDLHLVINNNFIFHEIYVDHGRDPFKETYAAFRLESGLRGKDGAPLTATDLSYTKQDFIDLIDYAKSLGVSITPEIDTPGHALSFTRLRPDLIYQGKMNHEKRRCEMLDAAKPETLRYVCNLLDEYLKKDAKLGRAVFAGCAVHIGADEFFGDKEDYRKYTDGILKHVLDRGYTPRVWGSLSSKPGKTPVISKGVQMYLWSKTWMKAWEAVNLGFDVINTNDKELYYVPYASYYRMDKNHKKLYEKWIPNRIDNETLPAGHPQLLGAFFAVWNDETDLKHSGYSPYDIWEPIAGSIDVLSQKMWGKAHPPRSFDQHRQLVNAIGRGNVNPLYKWKDSQPYTITIDAPLPRLLNKPALGPKYHLTMEVELASASQGTEQILLSGPEGELIGVMKDGTVGFRRNDALEFSFGAKLPVGEKVTIEIIGEPEKTRLLINGQETGTMTLNTFRNPDEDFKPRTKGLRSTFILPLKELGASDGNKKFQGRIHSMTVQPQ